MIEQMKKKKEVGMDFQNMQARKVGVFTDKTILNLYPVKAALESLDAAGISYEVFSACKIEPNQERSDFRAGLKNVMKERLSLEQIKTNPI
jgi:alcohol dehydrogenase class IV